MGKGKPYKFTANKKAQIHRLHGTNALFCFKCNKPLKVGQIIRRAGGRATRWYHNTCFEKTRQ